MTPKEIAEKIIKKGDNVTFRDWEIFCVNNAVELARAYLELDIDLRKAYVDESIKNDALKSEITKLKEENERLNEEVKFFPSLTEQRNLHEQVTMLKKSRDVLRNSLIYVRAESRRRSKENDQDEIYYGDYYNEADRAIKEDDEIMKEKGI